MAWFNKGHNPADVERARGFFERALALDPGNLDAVVGMACADAQAATDPMGRWIATSALAE
jgi:hypothetical protein